MLLNLLKLIPDDYNVYIGTDYNPPDEVYKCRGSKRVPKTFEGSYLGYINSVNWFFDEVEEGIILEEDILPHPDFFRFCEYFLKMYRHDKRVFHISGFNPLGRTNNYFSRLSMVWGYATWADRWMMYNDFDDVKKPSGLDKSIYETIKKQLYKYDTADVKWLLTIWNYNGWSIQSGSNLTKHIGYDSNSRHCKIDHFKKLKTYPIKDFCIYKENHDLEIFKKLNPNKFIKGLNLINAILSENN